MAIATGVGLVLGVAVARLGWRGIAHANGLVAGTVIPLWPVAAVVALAVVVPLLLSVVPTVRESRRHLGGVLRVE